MSRNSFQNRLEKIAEGNFSHLARRAGISQPRMSRNGMEPTLTAVVSMAKVTSVSVQWLATGEGEMRDYPISDSGGGGVEEGCLKSSLEAIDQYQKTFGVQLDRDAYTKAVCLVYRIVKFLYRRSDVSSKEVSEKIFSILQEKT